ncbi:MAG: TadE family protein [Pseudomonadota bacterium]
MGRDAVLNRGVGSRNATPTRSGGFSAFIKDESGAITTDMVMIFLPVILIVLTVFEIGISFYLLLSAQKAAQMGARFIVSEDPLHTGVPIVNALNSTGGNQIGDSCARADGGPSACVTPIAPDTIVNAYGNPVANGWLCDGAALNNAVCDEVLFNNLVTEMQIVYPGLTPREVRAYYTYEQLGYADGPFQPRVSVSIAARESPIQILSLFDLAWGLTGTTEQDVPVVQTGGVADAETRASNGNDIRLREVTASVFGADLNSSNVSD